LGLIVFGVCSSVLSKCQQDGEAESRAAAEQARRVKLTPEQRAEEDKQRAAAEESKRKADAATRSRIGSTWEGWRVVAPSVTVHRRTAFPSAGRCAGGSASPLPLTSTFAYDSEYP
jgi:hypothetical protein